MRKFMIALSMMFLCSLGTYAQKGMQGVGVNAAFNMSFDDGGAGLGGSVKYQYNISDFFRIEPSFSYYGPLDGDLFNMTALLNVHAFFMAPQAVRPYFFAGAGFVMFSDEHSYYIDNYREDTEDFGFNGGFGLDWRITHNWSFQVEAGLLMGVSDDDEIGGRASIGITYNF